jgi:hypothetical protein
MKTFIFLCFVLFAAIAGFIALNWSALSAPMTLSLGVAAIQEPLGWVMLGLLAVVSVFFLLWIVAAQISATREARSLSRELEVTNDLAREAEAYRYAELHQYIAKEIKTQSGREEASHQALLAKLSDLQKDLRTAIEESGNSLTAYFGRLEDQIERDHPHAGRR